MTTNDIELRSAVMGVITDVWDRAKQIDDAADEVLDLINADRQRRGEPVAWVTADTVNGQTVNGKPRRIWWENNDGVGMPIYTAPQPAEPVKRPYAQGTALGEFGIIPMCDQVDDEPMKVPSDADILDLWTGDTTHSRPVMGKNKVIAFARALLAREAVLRDRVANSRPTEQEPFGYFKAEPFGWTDCSPTDEGAIPLYERPAAPQPAQAQQPVSGADELLALARAALEPFADLGAWLFARNLPDDTPMVDVVHINNVKTTLTRGHFKAAYSAATDIDAALDAAVAADRAQAAPAAPQPAQQERKPLTRADYENKSEYLGCTSAVMRQGFEDGVRFAERMHGIRE